MPSFLSENNRILKNENKIHLWLKTFRIEAHLNR